MSVSIFITIPVGDFQLDSVWVVGNLLGNSVVVGVYLEHPDHDVLSSSYDCPDIVFYSPWESPRHSHVTS